MVDRTKGRWIAIGLAVLILGGGVPSPWAGDEEIPSGIFELEKAFVSIAQQVRPTVVAIETKTKIERPEITGQTPFPFRDFFGDEFWKRFLEPPEGERRGLGSGVIVSEDGYILTNNHVIRGATRINVTLFDGGKYEEAEVVGTDPLTDLAVVKIEVKDREDLPVIRLGDSDQLKVGMIVFAIGNPFEQYQTMTNGIVSALGRKGLWFGGGGPTYQNFIQTDADINPGNSGGALVNLRGELVGINTAIETRSGGSQGIGFAIPVNMAREVMEDLIDKGRVVRGYLGLYPGDVDADMSEALGLEDTKGALVDDIIADSPADRAGVQQGDVIVEVEDQSIKDADHLRNVVARIDPGTKVKVELFRDGKKKNVVVELGERPEEGEELRAKSETTDRLGIEVQPLTDTLARQLGYEGEEGVVISSVQPGSVAAEKGLRPRDLIKQIGRRRIRSLADYREAMKELKEDKAVILILKRGERSFYVALRVPRE